MSPASRLRRLAIPALIATLRCLDAIGDAELAQLRRYAHPAILNTRGETVGSIEAHVSL